MLKREEVVLAKDLAEKRRAAGITTEAMAEWLGCERPHLWKLETGHVSITMAKAAKAAAKLGPITVYVQGLGFFRVIPVGDKVPTSGRPMVPAEAAWLERKEVYEALKHLDELQKAIMRGDRRELVHIASECVVEPQAAINELAAALNRYDPTILRQAQAAYEVAQAQEEAAATREEARAS